MNESAIELAQLAEMSVVALFESAERIKARDGARPSAELFEAWLGRNGDHPLVHAVYFNLGVAYTEAGELLKAARAFRDGLRAKPDFTALRINLGRTLENLGDPKGAIMQWRDGLDRLAVINGEAVEQKSVLLTQSARLLQHHMLPSAAEPLLEQAIDLEPYHEAAVRDLIGLRTRQCRWPAISATKRVSAERQRALCLAAFACGRCRTIRCFSWRAPTRTAATNSPAPTRAEFAAVAAARTARNARGAHQDRLCVLGPARARCRPRHDGGVRDA